MEGESVKDENIDNMELMICPLIEHDLLHLELTTKPNDIRKLLIQVTNISGVDVEEELDIVISCFNNSIVLADNLIKVGQTIRKIINIESKYDIIIAYVINRTTQEKLSQTVIHQLPEESDIITTVTKDSFWGGREALLLFNITNASKKNLETYELNMPLISDNEFNYEIANDKDERFILLDNKLKLNKILSSNESCCVTIYASGSADTNVSDLSECDVKYQLNGDPAVNLVIKI